MFSSPVELVTLVLLMVVVSLFTMRFQGTSQQQPSNSVIQVLPTPVTVAKGDDRYSIAPRPQRVWQTGPDTSSVQSALDPIPTRGYPEEYQQMGVITGGDGKVLPLYGRRVAPRSDRFNYYTRTDTYNPVALPVIVKKRDCQDSTGCDELFNGDDVRLAATGDVAKVTMYGFDGPRYVG